MDRDGVCDWLGRFCAGDYSDGVCDLIGDSAFDALCAAWADHELLHHDWRLAANPPKLPATRRRALRAVRPGKHDARTLDRWASEPAVATAVPRR